jgi:hypothetical protein
MADLEFTAGLDAQRFRRELRRMEGDSAKSGRRIEGAFGAVAKRFITVGAAVSLYRRAIDAAGRHSDLHAAQLRVVEQTWDRILGKSGAYILDMATIPGSRGDVARRAEADRVKAERERIAFERRVSRENQAEDFLSQIREDRLRLEGRDGDADLEARGRRARQNRRRVSEFADTPFALELEAEERAREAAERSLRTSAAGHTGFSGGLSQQVRNALGIRPTKPPVLESFNKQHGPKKADSEPTKVVLDERGMPSVKLNEQQMDSVQQNFESLERTMESGFRRSMGWQ